MSSRRSPNSEALGHNGLRHARRLALRDQQLTQLSMTFGVERFRQLGSRQVGASPAERLDAVSLELGEYQSSRDVAQAAGWGASNADHVDAGRNRRMSCGTSITVGGRRCSLKQSDRFSICGR
jgi:hypothetical protein